MATTSQHYLPFQSNLGLLTTVAQLPHKYKIRYILPESPLDLSVKPNDDQQHDNNNHLLEESLPIQLPLISPPISSESTNSSSSIPLAGAAPLIIQLSPTTSSSSSTENYKRKFNSIQYTDDEFIDNESIQENDLKKYIKSEEIESLQQVTLLEETVVLTTKSDQEYQSVKEITPKKQIIKSISTIAPKTLKNQINIGGPTNGKKSTATGSTRKQHQQHKAVRKLKFDENKSSPVSGTIIRSLSDINIDTINDIDIESGDIDPQYNIVEVTDEAKAEIAQIPNVIGSYTCKLCRIEFEDVFCLARHRCSCIVLLEYRCPECGKRFNCPANLASHRRWHKPKNEINVSINKKCLQENNDITNKSNNNINNNKNNNNITNNNNKNNNNITNNNNNNNNNNNDNNKDDNTKLDQQSFPCTDCGKLFKRQAYLKKHLLTHKDHKPNNNNKTINNNIYINNNNNNNNNNRNQYDYANIKNLQSSISYKSSDDSNSNSDLVNSVCSGVDGGVGSGDIVDFSINNNNFYQYDNYNKIDDCSSPNFHLYQSASFTEDENIAVSALTHLARNGPSVIRHTTAVSV